jgi:ferrous iron transport protein B
LNPAPAGTVGPLRAAAGAPRQAPWNVALVGNPNAGKTTLFNVLTGLRAKTANFPGTTIERHSGRFRLGARTVELLDLPGLYSLTATTAEERLAHDTLCGLRTGERRPDAVVLILDATNLERNLVLASQTLELGVPTIVALNMIDLAERAGTRIDVAQLSAELGCPVVPIAARSGRGVEQLREGLAGVLGGPLALTTAPAPVAEDACHCSGCPFRARFDWAEGVGARCMTARPAEDRRTERIDRVLTHPVVGVAAFSAVMLVVFSLIFWIAQYPMGWIEQGFALAGSIAGAVVPQADLRSLLVDGVIGGVGGVLVFLPQICILFLFLSLLEDTGYLARAAFVMDRLMRRVGLPGKAFVPMVSAHACAVPAIMSTRVIEDRRDRLVTILVLPLLTCSARIPVFAMLTALLFAGRPLAAALAFTGAYAMGLLATLGMALVLRRTILPGEARPLVLELPSYKLPSLRTALLATWDRAAVFLRTAGSVILIMSIGMWALATYPKSGPSTEAQALTERAGVAEATGDRAGASALRADAARVGSRDALAHSFAGRLGHFIEPAIAPLGFDWRIGVGVIGSFVARETIVSTLAIVFGAGDGRAGDDPQSLYERLGKETRRDGAAVFSTATCASLLVFYVLAMQCMSTLAVTRRETGSWRWAALQFAYMTVLAWGGAFVAYRLALLL